MTTPPDRFRRRPLVAIAALAAFAATTGLNPQRPPAMAAAAEQPEKPQPPLPEPRDPEIAVREEYDAAIAADTVAALDLFIRRHPDHALAELARRELERLQAEQGPQ
jgi:hypothetical protein